MLQHCGFKPNNQLRLHCPLHDDKTASMHGDAARLSMDSLGYFYKANTNQLHKVTDAAVDALPGDYSRSKSGSQIKTNLLKQGHDVSMVQAIAGHKYLSSTERYKQNEIETLRDAVNKYHPFG